MDSDRRRAVTTISPADGLSEAVAAAVLPVGSAFTGGVGAACAVCAGAAAATTAVLTEGVELACSVCASAACEASALHPARSAPISVVFVIQASPTFVQFGANDTWAG